jgi:hypothetical protein
MDQRRNLMYWKFWESKKPNDPASASANTKLPKPKDLPDRIGRHLVVDQKLNPDYVWTLRCALSPRPERKNYFNFRIFDPAQARAAGCQVENYNRLDDHPDLILYEGRYDFKSHSLELENVPPLPSAA